MTINCLSPIENASSTVPFTLISTPFCGKGLSCHHNDFTCLVLDNKVLNENQAKYLSNPAGDSNLLTIIITRVLDYFVYWRYEYTVAASNHNSNE